MTNSSFSKTRMRQPRGAAWVAMQALFLGVLAVAAPMWRGAHALQFWPTAIGAACGLIGGVVAWCGAKNLGRSLTPFPRPSAGAELIVSGIYAHIRHPLYASVAILAVGWTVLWQSLPAAAVTVALLVFLRAKAAHEEALLRNLFLTYADYARRVPRFFPRLFGLSGK
jgi:protein-S-isoprenylcysteine O-methyltransferase Ste14